MMLIIILMAGVGVGIALMMTTVTLMMLIMILMAGVGVGMALTSPDQEGEMATNALVVLQVKNIIEFLTIVELELILDFSNTPICSSDE